eukprot:TRINITY_DN6393_c0_g1_i1.p1 TRINITY_DN6393_c0_g1~~TRINITY_DN6393_c0_g1_i1.p1  ORF type:complete len:502 (-),score=51.55 TRINITY_DN6393_c0_g1_i1:102-1607(-)
MAKQTPRSGAEEEEVDSPGIKVWFVVGANMASMFLFSGCIFGFAPLQLLLEKDGVYADACTGLNPHCDERTAKIIMLYTVGSTATVIGQGPCGLLVDNLGPLKCTVLCGIIETVGLVLLGISSNEEGGVDALPLGTAMIGFAGILVTLNAFPSAFIVPSSYLPIICSLFSCIFDASSIVFWFVYKLYAVVGLSRQTLFIGFGAISAVTHFVLAVSWMGEPVSRLRAVQAAEKEAQNTKNENKDVEATTVGQCDADDGKVASSKSAGQLARPPLHGLPLREQLCTFEFMFAVTYVSLNMFRSNAHLGLNKSLLESLGDESTGHTYTQIFTISLPLSVVFAPLISRFMQMYGFAACFFMTSALGLIWNGVALVPWLPLQLVSFAAFTNARAFLYSTFHTYMSFTFGSRTYGTVIGILAVFASILNFLIWPLSILAGEFGLHYIYWLLLACSGPAIFMAFLLRRRLIKMPVCDCCVPQRKSAETSEDLTTSIQDEQGATTIVSI